MEVSVITIKYMALLVALPRPPKGAFANAALSRANVLFEHDLFAKPVPRFSRSCSRFFATFIRLETVARPHQRDHGAVIGKGAVGKRHLRAGPLQQRARD